MSLLAPFKESIYVNRPLLPDLDKVHEKLQEVWDSKWLTNMGRQHNTLEEKLITKLKVPNLSLFNNGTTALIAAIRSLDLKGDVITTPFTFAATPHSIALNNLNPIFCDVDDYTMNIDPTKIEALITPTTSAIVAVHVFGTPCDVKKIQDIADRHHLKVIYDAAHAFDTEIDGVGIGNFGDVTMFSFHATKLFHSTEGGALAFKDSSFKKKLELIKNFGIVNEDEVSTIGLNGKLNEIQAVIGQLVLEMVEEEKAKRNRLQKVYCEKLHNINGITVMPAVSHNNRSSYQYFVIRINESQFGMHRDQVYEELKKYNVFSRKYFHPLCSNYDCYRDLSSANRSNLPVANRIAEEVISLPFYGDLTSQDVEKICEIIKSLQC